MQAQETQQKERFPLLEAGVNYSLAAVLPALFALVFSLIAGAFGKEVQEENWYRYLSYLLPQLCFAGACLVFFKRNPTLVKPSYRPCKWYYYLFGIALAFGMLSLGEANGYFIKLLEKIGYKSAGTTLPNVEGWYLLPAILVIALLPAIFEETVFRGIQVSAMRRAGWGTASTAFLSGALFSLFHCNPEQTIYQFLCGATYGLLAVRSGSPFPTMIAHFCNNALILCLQSAGITAFSTAVAIPLYSVAGAVLLALLVYLVFFDKNNRQKGKMRGGSKFFLGASIGIIACAVQWLVSLITGCL